MSSYPSSQDGHRHNSQQQQQQQQQKQREKLPEKFYEDGIPKRKFRKRTLDLLQSIPKLAFRFVRLLSFVVFLLPAFIVFIWHYFTCDRVTVPYRRNHCLRHYLDVYGSRSASYSKEKKKPVVVFLTGGAWIIGYRMWGALLARALVSFGALVIVPDYRNFPWVGVPAMVDDVDSSIVWVLENVGRYGGDEGRVLLVGQSAGAHIGACIVARKVLDWIRQRKRELLCNDDSNSYARDGSDLAHSPPLLKSTYAPHQLRGFVSTSAPYNLLTMRQVLRHHGLTSAVQTGIFGHDDHPNNDHSDDGDIDQETLFSKWSPYHLVQRCHEEYLELQSLKHALPCNAPSNKTEMSLKHIFPKLCVIHGTQDKTVPISQAIEFEALLQRCHIPCVSKYYRGWSHTDPILESPMLGDHLYHRHVYELLCSWTAVRDNHDDIHHNKCNSNYNYGDNDGDFNCEDSDPKMPSFDEKHRMLRPICPRILVQLARFCNPF